jgi:hypothetical protein
MKAQIMAILFFLSQLSSAFAVIPEAKELRAPGDINELDRYVLTNNLCHHDHPPNHFSRECTIAHLPHGVLVEKIKKEMADLLETIERTKTTLALDERLRWQVWNLSESILILEAIVARGNVTDPDADHPLKIEAEKLVRVGYRTFLTVREQIKEILTLEKEKPEIQDVVELASAGKIPQYAEKLEKELDLTSWNKTHQACGSTGRALFFYFERKYRMSRLAAEPVRYPVMGMGQLVMQLEQNRDSGGAYLYLIESNKLDHVFVIQQTLGGRYRLLQSYVGEYSLEASLAEQFLLFGGLPDLSYEELMGELQDLEALLHADALTEEVEELHKGLFHIPPPRTLKGEFAASAPHLQFSTMQYL